MPGTGDPALDAILSQIGGGAAQNTGPSASGALGGNYLQGGKAPMVYWGANPNMPANTGDGDPRRAAIAQSRDIAGTSDSTLTLQDAVSDWYKWSDAERAGFAKRLYGLGMISDPNDLYGQSGAFGMWQNAVQTASNFYMAAGRKVTPWQAIDLMANAAGGGPQSKTQTNTSKSFNIPTVEDAHAATRQLFQALMGRDPDENEQDRYASMMTAYAQKHPTVTKQTQTTDIHGNTTSSSTSSGGYSQGGVTDMLSQKAKADPEYGSYQAATTYFNALVGAMGGLGGGNG
jgi:hypothetical protein